MGLVGEAIEQGAREGRRRLRRQSSRPRRSQPQEFTRALGLGGKTPFSSDLHAEHVATEEASRALPSRPSRRETTRAYNKTFPHAYERAVVEVFDAQPQRVKQQVLARARAEHSREGEIILRHAHSQNPFIATEDSESPFKAFGKFAKGAGEVLKEGLTPYSPSEIGGALRGEPSTDPQLSRLANTQSALAGFSRFASGLVDKGHEKGLLGAPKTAGPSVGLNPQIGLNAVKDAVNIPAEAIPSIALPASQALSGDVKGAGRTLAQPYVDLAKDPGRAFREHPLATTLMVYGPASTASRGLGSAGRTADIGAFSTERAPATVPGTALAKVRTYHGDPIVKAGQVAHERFKRRQAREYERQATELDVEATRQPHLAANFQSQAAELRRKAAEKNPDLMSGHQIGKVMDDLEAVNQAVRSAHIHETTGPVRSMNKAMRAGGHAVSPIAQSIVKPELGDIQAYLGELRSIHDSGALTPYEMSANRALRAGLERAVDRAHRGKFDPARVRAEIERVYLPLRKRLDAELARRDMLPTERAERAALVPFAARHMGATYDLRKSAPEHMAVRFAQIKDLERQAASRVTEARHAERSSLADLQRAYRDLATARGHAGHAQGRAEVISGRADRTRGRRPADLGRIPRRTLARLERERGRLLEREQLVARAREVVVEAKAGRRAAEQEFRAVRKQRERSDPKRYTTGLVDREGRRLPTDAIRAQMEAEGFPEPAWITQAPNMRGAKNFYQHWSSAPSTVGTHARTGQATVKGTFDAHPDTLLESVARSQGLIDVHDGFARAMREGLYRKSGKVTTFHTRRQAEMVAQNLAQIPGTPGWRVVNIRPFARRGEDLRDVLDGTTTDDATAESVAEILTDALDAKGEGPFGIVPEAFANQMQRHINVLSSGAELKLWRLASGAFRRTVLATSPTWLAGNAVEAYARTGINRATPADAIFARKVMGEMERQDPEFAATFRARAQQGGLMAFTRATVRTGAEQFRDSSPALAATARAAGAFWRTRGPRQLAGLWERYTNFVFGGLNQAVELPPQLAMTGAYLRRHFGLSHREVATSAKAVRQAAEGMMDTPEQIAMAQSLRRSYGQYFAFGPTERKVIALYTPFAAWSLNAVKFLYSTLPADHPALTALIADAHVASEDWRREHGLDLFMGRGALPDFLQGSIPTSRGGHFRGFTRYTPFGFAGDPTGNVASLVLPQISGLQAAFEGRDWTGKPLRNDDGTPYDPLRRFMYGTSEFATALIPIAGKVQQYMGKEGPPQQRLSEMLNPFGVTPGRRSGSAGTGIRVPSVRIPSVKVPSVRVEGP